jgi:TRAP-type C4-dicarboxylate transport system permease small subunit
MKTIAKIITIASIIFNFILFGIYFWALSDTLQNPEFKNLPIKDYLLIGIGLIIFAIINIIFVKILFKKSLNIYYPTNK